MSQEQNSPFTFIDLFAGIGGFRMALEANGGKCLGFSEINRDAIEAYCANSSETETDNLGNICKIDTLPDHDFLTAGVPCQSWSIAGHNLGFDDDRGQLWNDTLFLLKKSRPKAFIFENVKGLADPRNQNALTYIMQRINEAGYHANYYLVNSADYAVPQTRTRVYIIGFSNKNRQRKFRLPQPQTSAKKLGDHLGIDVLHQGNASQSNQDLFGSALPEKRMSLSATNGYNDYFLFNDLRNGETTIHSWDIIKTTERQKHICYILLKNRRKKTYGKLDGNPLSLTHFQNLDNTITQSEIDQLVALEIFKPEEYLFSVKNVKSENLSEHAILLLQYVLNDQIIIDDLKRNRELKLKKISLFKAISELKEKKRIRCTEVRYDFKNTKISTGLYGINRVFLPSANAYPTLVASDTNDYIALQDIIPSSLENHKEEFIQKIYHQKKYRKITRQEACLIQGFPQDFILPEKRTRWMKLIGNSVSVHIIDLLCKAIIDTGVFDSCMKDSQPRTHPNTALSKQL